jgi:hypothetical protein
MIIKIILISLYLIGIVLFLYELYKAPLVPDDYDI